MFNMISLDGYFVDADGTIDWHTVDDEFNEFAVEQTQSFGGMIFGRTTYQLFEGYWPAELKNPDTSPEDRQIAQAIDEKWKMVYSKTLTDADITWHNTKLLHKIDHEEVMSWKQMDGGDLVIFGSGQIVAEFAKQHLIDEYRFMLSPVVLGGGKKLFKEHMKLHLEKMREFKNGNVLLTYTPEKGH